jgi:glycosyltransferase involved in cell wall biosynthesis
MGVALFTVFGLEREGYFPAPMTHALAVSLHFPATDHAVHGVFQRLDVGMQALCASVDSVDFLCLDTPHRTRTPELLDQWQSFLRQRWCEKVSLRHEPVVESELPDTIYQNYVRGLFDYRAVHPLPKVLHGRAEEALLRALESGPDLIYAHRLSAMAALLGLPDGAVRAPIVFDLDDIEHVAYARRLWRGPADWRERLRFLHLGALVACEVRAFRAAAVTLVCSDFDRRQLARRLARGCELRVLANSVRIPEAPAAPGSEPTVLFVGTFAYKPNVAAAELLVTRVWPSIKAAVPDARLRLVGNGPDRVPCSASPPDGVTFTGFVADLDAEYAAAHVVCCPILSGGGTRLKIIEAAAHARPVVSTTLGAEGLNLQHGREIVLADTPTFLAQGCVDLLQDREKAQLIGQAARERVRALYDREAVDAQCRRIIGEVIATREVIAA